MVKYFINTFHPICSTKFGREAVGKYKIPPYVDCSCRREPDFESEFPSITAICRVNKFAPRLNKGHKIIYLTVQGSYEENLPLHYKLIAALEVIERFENHMDAAEWYKKQELRIPSNCLVENNPPIPIENTFGGRKKDLQRFNKYPENLKRDAMEKYLKEWDKEYWERVNKYPVFLITKKEYLELNDPKIIYPDDLLKIFGRIPRTQNPPEITESEYKNLFRYIKN